MSVDEKEAQRNEPCPRCGVAHGRPTANTRHPARFFKVQLAVSGLNTLKSKKKKNVNRNIFANNFIVLFGMLILKFLC